MNAATNPSHGSGGMSVCMAIQAAKSHASERATVAVEAVRAEAAAAAATTGLAWQPRWMPRRLLGH